jgi:hypothetical protein
MNGGLVLSRRALVLAPGVLAALAPAAARAEWLRDGIVVYAEPALRPVLSALSSAYRRAHPGLPALFTAPPGQMLGLLAHGTQADILITQTGFMDRAVAGGLVADARRTLWRNRLVIAGRGDASGGGRGDASGTAPFSAAGLLAALNGGVLAVPDATDASAVDGPALVRALGVNARIQGTASTGDALDMVRQGTAALAVCHRTELMAARGVVPVMTLPDASYPQIVYQAALTKTAWSRFQDDLLAYLAGPAAPAARDAGLEVVA